MIRMVGFRPEAEIRLIDVNVRRRLDRGTSRTTGLEHLCASQQAQGVAICLAIHPQHACLDVVVIHIGVTQEMMQGSDVAARL